MSRPSHRDACQAFRWEESARAMGFTAGAPVNLGRAIVDRHAGSGRPALRWFGKRGEARTYTFDELARLTARFANVLRARGVGPGDRVVGFLPRIPEMLLAMIGTWKVGAVYVPIFTGFGPDAIEFRVRHSGARVLVTQGEHRGRLPEPLPDGVTVITVAGGAPGDVDFWRVMDGQPDVARLTDVRREDPAVLLYTSGSTGPPKGVKIESSAMLPTTTRVMASHPVRGGESEDREAVGKHRARGPGQYQAAALDGRRLPEHPALVVPAVGHAGQILEIGADAVRLAITGRPLESDGKRGQRLGQLGIFRRGQLAHVDVGADALRLHARDPEDPAHPRVRHLHVEHRVLLPVLLQRRVEVEVQVALRAPRHHEPPEDVHASQLVEEVVDRDVGRPARRHLHLDAAARDRHELVDQVADPVGRQPESPDGRHHVLRFLDVVGALHEFFGGYLTEAGYGFGHWAPHDAMPGQKLWLWSLARDGGIWEDLLTDTDGQYVEYQAGRLLVQYQPAGEVNPIAQVGFDPGATDRWSETWFPLEGTGGLTAASREGAARPRTIEEGSRSR